MIENGLTQKINPNTNIFNSVINAVQTFKRVVYMTSQCSAKQRVLTHKLLRAVQLQLVASKGIRDHFL
jgi:hypothetical protein